MAAVRRKDETTTRSNKNGDYRIHSDYEALYDAEGGSSKEKR
nr:MAG TPA: hypothetical protein [Caudoviricetes sp.]